ncbi:MAG: hypothetical protein R3F59_00210 [Myxococcota bacterium]
MALAGCAYEALGRRRGAALLNEVTGTVVFAGWWASSARPT